MLPIPDTAQEFDERFADFVQWIPEQEPIPAISRCYPIPCSSPSCYSLSVQLPNLIIIIINQIDFIQPCQFDIPLSPIKDIFGQKMACIINNELVSFIEPALLALVHSKSDKGKP